MNIRSYPFFVLCLAFSMLLGLSGCGDLQQDLKINADGSGRLETTFDVGELLGMTQGFNALGMDQDSITDDVIIDTSSSPPPVPKDAMTLFMDKIIDPAHDRDVDTLMSILSIMPDSIRQKETRPDLAQKINIHVKSPALSSDLTIGVVMDFKDTRELKDLIQYMQSMDKGSDVMSSAVPMGMDSESFLVFDLDMKAGWIKIDTIRYDQFSMQLGMPQDSTAGSEDLAMMEMMFGNSKIKSVIHVPGEVLSCSNPDALLTKDNKVILEHPLMDVINKGKIDGYTIYFTPQK